MPFRGSSFAALIQFAVLVPLGLPEPASAQSGAPPDMSQLVRHATRADEREALLAVGRAQTAGASCSNVVLDFIEPPTAFSRLRFENGRLVEGAWIQPLRAAGCGATGRLSVLTIVAPGKPVERLGLLPGDTFADPILQRDGVRFADAVARASVRGCERSQIMNTRFAGSREEAGALLADLRSVGRATKPWTEAWQMSACGKTVMVRIQFIPNDRGTAISAAPVEPSAPR